MNNMTNDTTNNVCIQQAKMEREIELLKEQDMRARSELDRTLHHVNNAEAALLQGTNV